MPQPELTLVIQAGGASRRMGQDKGLLPFHGTPLVTRLLARLGPLAAEHLVTTNHPEDYAFLDVPRQPDLQPGRGALGGLFTALSCASRPLVAVVACDMPFASPDLLRAQLAMLAAEPWDTVPWDAVLWDAVIPAPADGLEPFHAVYRRATCLPLVEAALAADRWRVDAWFPQAKIRFLTPEELAPFHPREAGADAQPLPFWNVNTPEELRRSEDFAAAYPHL
jgi:molybdopterin-guanine dinucleotide biosynthesis protein A